MRLPLWTRYLLILLLSGGSGGLAILAASYLYLAPQLPEADKLRDVEYQIPLRIYSQDLKLIAEYGEKRRQPVTYEELPEPLIQAILAAEDERFFSHNGVDVRGLVRAALELVRYREIRSGGSTITMQVARNFFLGREQRFLRKFNEIVLAIQIEQVLSKEDILELYLNKIYLGHRAYGAQAAAHVYYGKPVSELSVDQQAMIAGLPKAPSAYNPITNPERALIRRNWILQRMEETGALSHEARLEAQQAPVSATFHAASPEVEAAYFGEMVRLQAIELVESDLFTDGIRIITTLDSEKQTAAVTALRNGLHEYDERHGYRGALKQHDVSTLPKLTTLADATSDSQEDNANDAALTAWLALLDDHKAVAALEPVIVSAVDKESADILFSNGERHQLSWEALSWARPYINDKNVGREPKEAGDILDAGDIVMVRPDEEHGWRLAQHPRAQSALVSLDPNSGAILALQGGYSFATSKFNRAVQGERQAGSVFKPFIYTSALENGFTPATLINDAPIVFDDDQLETAWRPSGASGKFFGPTRMREALYRSLNLVSIRLLRQVGISQALGTIRRFGLPAERFQRDLSLALGSASVTPLEVATAYSVFANGGYRVTPWSIQRIEKVDGDILWQAPEVRLCSSPCDPEREIAAIEAASPALDPVDENHQQGDTSEAAPAPAYPLPVFAPQVLDKRVAWLMNSMLQDVVRRGTGYKASRLGRNDLAGKTGTTNDQVDAWFSGYSPSLVATVWVGFDAPSNLGRGEYGGKAALPIWIDYMGTSLQGAPQQQREQPFGIVSVRINPENGLLARPGNPSAIREYFRDDQVPELEPPLAITHTPEGGEPEQIF